MIPVEIPGMGILQLEHLVCDVNGTLALDGQLLEGVAMVFKQLGKQLQIHLATADTHGRQDVIDRQLDLSAVRLRPGGNEAEQKAELVRSLGAEHTVTIGQGANDAAMLKEAALGICVLSKEGTATSALLSADLLAPDILTALDLLLNPKRIVASLRK
jgi:P-type E1-E2 ATPase